MAFKLQPLNQEEYQMKIVEDLGQVPSKTNPSRSYRHAIFECSICHSHFEARATGTAAKNQTKCSTCAKTKFRQSDHPLYAIWNGIKQRCYSPARKDYHKYGGKGVTMCDEWKDDPKLFIEWCEANGWIPGLVVDKDIKSAQLGISPAIYSPETISFITTQENAEEANAKVVLQYTLDGDLICEHHSVTSATLSLGKPKTSKAAIANCCRGLTHTAFNYKWKYKNT